MIGNGLAAGFAAWQGYKRQTAAKPSNYYNSTVTTNTAYTTTTITRTILPAGTGATYSPPLSPSTEYGPAYHKQMGNIPSGVIPQYGPAYGRNLGIGPAGQPGIGGTPQYGPAFGAQPIGSVFGPNTNSNTGLLGLALGAATGTTLGTPTSLPTTSTYGGTQNDYLSTATGLFLGGSPTGFMPTSYEYHKNQQQTQASKFGMAGIIGGVAANMVFGKNKITNNNGQVIDVTRIDPNTGNPLALANPNSEEYKTYAAFEEYKRKSAETGVAIINGPSVGPKNSYYANGKWYKNTKDGDKEVKPAGWKDPKTGKANKNVAKTTFETGPNTKLATPDYYNDPVTNPVNTIQTNPSIYDSNSIIAQKQQAALAGQQMQMGDNISLTDQYGNFNPLVLTNVDYVDTWDKLKKTFKNPGEFNNLFGKDFVRGFLTEMGYRGDLEEAVNFLTTKPSIFKKRSRLRLEDEKLKVLIAGESYEVPSDQIDKYIGMNYLLGELTGEEELMKLLDMGTHMSILLALLREGIKDRIPEIIQKALDQATDPTDKRKLRLAGVWIAAEESYLKYIYDVVEDEEYGKGIIISTFPEIITLILENFKFKFKEEYQNMEYSTYLIDLLFILNSNWLTYKRNNTNINSVEKLGDLTEDAYWALQGDERTFIVAVLAKAHPPTDAVLFTLEHREFAPVNRKMWQ